MLWIVLNSHTRLINKGDFSDDHNAFYSGKLLLTWELSLAFVFENSSKMTKSGRYFLMLENSWLTDLKCFRSGLYLVSQQTSAPYWLSRTAENL